MFLRLYLFFSNFLYLYVVYIIFCFHRGHSSQDPFCMWKSYGQFLYGLLLDLHSDLLHFMHRNARYSIKCLSRGKTSVRILVRIASFHGKGLIIYLRCTTCLLLASRRPHRRESWITSMSGNANKLQT